MKRFSIIASAIGIAVASAHAQTVPGGADGALAGRSPVGAPSAIELPGDTLIQVTTASEITSIRMKEGDKEMMQVATDVAENGRVIIPRGAPVIATVTWRTGKGIGGKSAKFEITFNSVTVRGKQYALKGKYRAEGRGNTVGALLGSMIITGKSATIVPGQVVPAFTAEAIPSA